MGNKNLINRITAAIVVMAFIFTQSGPAYAMRPKEVPETHVAGAIGADLQGEKGKPAVGGAISEQAFPLKYVKEVIEEATGWSLSRRGGEPKVVGTGRMDLTKLGSQDAIIDQVVVIDDPYLAEVGATLGYLRAATVLLAGYRQSDQTGAMDRILNNTALPPTIEVQYVRDNDTVIDTSPVSPDIAGADTTAAIRFDTDMPSQLSDEHRLGIEALYALGLYHQIARRGGLDEPQSVTMMLSLYNMMPQEHRQALEAVLQQPFIDSNNILLTFLRNARNAEGLEQTRWVSWLIGQTRKEYAYDVNAIRDCLARHAAKDGIHSEACHREVHKIMTGTYKPEVEEENIRQIVQAARQRGQEIVFERFGHVGHIVGSLFAASKVVVSFEEVVEVCSELDGLIGRQDAKRLGKSLDQLRYAANYLLRLSQRKAGDITTEADLKRAASRLAQARDRFRKEAEAAINRYERAELSRITRDVALDARPAAQVELKAELQAVRADLADAITGLDNAGTSLRFAIENSPKRDALYVFILQRLSRTGTPAVAAVNELLMPYATTDPYGTDVLIAQGGHNVHATPSYEALRLCDHAVESLPLFIYEEGGKTYIDQDAIEQTIRLMAEDWALNIEDAQRTGRKPPTFSLVTTQAYNMSRLVMYWLEEEMANYRLIRDRGWEAEVREVMAGYRRDIHTAIRQALDEVEGGDLWSEVEQMQEDDASITEEKALEAVMDTYAEVSEAVPVIAVVNKHAPALEAAGFKLDSHQARIEALKACRLDPQTATAVKAEDGYEGYTLYDMALGFMRGCHDLAFSTSRKQVIAQHMLKGDVTQADIEAAWISSTGPNKGYNVGATPNRINLGPDQIESVVELGQAVGPFDREAAMALSTFWRHINYSPEGVLVSLYPEGAEGHKIDENALSRDALYALSNTIAITSQYVGTADARAIIDAINIRGDRFDDRRMLPPGEGYGGFCIPKDGKFKKHVQSLKDEEVLRSMGIPEQDIPIVAEIARDALRKRSQFATLQEWQEYVQAQLPEQLKGLDRPVYMPSTVRVADIVDRLGEPAEEEGRYTDEQFGRDTYLFAVERSVDPARQVNDFMPYFKANMILQALTRAGVPIEQARVGIQACYKPNVHDTRLATAWDIFLALIGSTKRLDNMQEDVRELALKGLRRFSPHGSDALASVREVRLIDPLMTRDNWGSKPGELEALAGDVTRDILDARDGQGKPLNLMTRQQLEAAAVNHGADLSRWPGLAGHPELRDRLRNAIHFITTYARGVENDVWRGIRGLDVLNLGVPHDPVLAMLDNLPAVAEGMREGNPDSPLILVDGPTGAEPAVMDEDMIMEWLSLGGTYLDIGRPDGRPERDEGIILSLRRSMEERRELADNLRKQVLSGDRAGAQATFETLAGLVANDRTIEQYEAMRNAAARQGREQLVERYDLVIQTLHRVAMDVDVRKFDFYTWFILGGRYAIADADPATREGLKTEFEGNIGNLAVANADGAPGVYTEGDALRLDAAFGTSATYTELVDLAAKAKGPALQASALKGASTTKAKAVDAREQRKKEMARKAALRERSGTFHHYMKEVVSQDASIDDCYTNAMQSVADPGGEVTQRHLGMFLAHTRQGLLNLIDAQIRPVALQDVDRWEAERLAAAETDEQKAEIRDRAARARQAAEKTLDDFAAFVRGPAFSEEFASVDNRKKYEQFGGKKGAFNALARLANGRKDLLEKIARAMALVDTALAIELATQAEEPDEVWVAMANFYDASLNCHIFDYMPYPFTESAYKDHYNREELFGLFERCYTWVYNYCTVQLKTRTELSERDEGYVNNLFTMAIQSETPGEEFCYNYARPRDLATQMHDIRVLTDDPGWLPQVVSNVDPAALKLVTPDAKDVTEGNPAVVILYPFGNTTVAIHAYYSGRQHPGHSLFISPFLNEQVIDVPVTDENPEGKQTVITMKQGMLYLTHDEYLACVESSGGDVAAARKYLEGRPEDVPIGTFIEFREPILVSCVAPHFKHPMYKKGAFREAQVATSWTEALEELSYYKTEQADPRFLGNTGIAYPEQVNWYENQSEGKTLADVEDQIRDMLLAGLPEATRKVIIKPSKQSGGRGIVICRIRNDDGAVYEGNLEDKDAEKGLLDAIRSIHEIADGDDAVVQEFLYSSPKGLVTDAFWEEIKARYTAAGIAVGEDPELYWCFRTITSQGRPGTRPTVTAWINLISPNEIANFGQGSLMFELKRENLKPEFQTAVDAMEQQSSAMMQAYEDYAPVFAAEHNLPVGEDLAGVSNARPTSLLLDWMIVPDKFDEAGNPIAVKVPTVEQNIGYGQFYPHNAQLPDERKGEGVDALVDHLADRGECYSVALQAIREGRPVPPIVGTEAAATGSILVVTDAGEQISRSIAEVVDGCRQQGKQVELFVVSADGNTKDVEALEEKLRTSDFEHVYVYLASDAARAALNLLLEPIRERVVETGSYEELLQLLHSA